MVPLSVPAKKNVVVLFYPVSWPGKDFRNRLPFSLIYLERMARDLDVEIKLIDESLTPDFQSVVKALQPRILLAGVSSMTGYQIKGGIVFSKFIRELDRAIPILWGGWHPTLMPEQTLAEDYIDYVAAGQGEDLIRAMLQRMLAGEPLFGIPGLWIKKPDGSLVVPPVNKTRDTKAFPDADLSLLDLDRYVFENTYATRVLGYHASHGCPFDCSFCCVAKVYEKRWYNKDVETIINDLRVYKDKANIDAVIFDDDNFFVGRAKSMALVNALYDSGLNLRWDTSAHPASFVKTFTEDDVALMYKSGCRMIYCGAESGSEEVLVLVNKKSDVEANFKFVELLERHNIKTLFSTMVAFPTSPDEDLRDTLEMIRQAKLKVPSLRVRIFFYTPYPGTPLFDLAKTKGLVPPDHLEGWTTYTLRKFVGPWWTRDYRWEIERFANFYLPFADSKFYEVVPSKYRPIAYVLTKVFHPIVRYRWTHNKLGFPIEAEIFLRSLRVFNSVFKTDFCLGYEAYVEAAPPLGIASRLKALAEKATTRWSREPASRRPPGRRGAAA